MHPLYRILPFYLFPAIAMVAAWGPTGGRACGAEEAWRTGSDFRRQLQLSTGISWAETPLRQGLTNLSRNQRVAIWLDRRIDPGQAMELSADNVTLDALLRKIGGRLNVGVSYVDAVSYFGPPHVAGKLATLAVVRRTEAGRLAPAARLPLQRRQAWQWPQLTTPRQLLAQLADEAGIRVVGDDQLPHDLWAAGDLPPLALTDRLTLLLAGFDLTFEIAPDGSAIRLIPMPESVTFTHTFTPRVDLARATAQLTKEFPQVEFQQAGQRLTATGSFEDLELIGRLLRGEQVTRTAVTGDTAFTLKVANAAAGAIINEIARRRQLTVKVHPAVKESLQTPVSFEVEEVTLDELLKATLEPARIGYRLEGNTLELLPVPP